MACKSNTQMSFQLISNLCLKPVSNDCVAGAVISKSGYELGLGAGCGVEYRFMLGNEIAVGITKKIMVGWKVCYRKRLSLSLFQSLKVMYYRDEVSRSKVATWACFHFERPVMSNTKHASLFNRTT